MTAGRLLPPLFGLLLMTACSFSSSDRVAAVRARIGGELKQTLDAEGFKPGSEVYLRIFKEEKQLELWMRKGPRFTLLRTWPVCRYSGNLGPKLKEGDRQAPEGCYEVRPEAMNPRSRYHLSFNLGYPNRYDRAHRRTGSFLMVHGRCLSIGCYAMTDPVIEWIYLLMDDAFAAGQPVVRVDCFPFRPTPEALARRADSPWREFWGDLAEGYTLFEREKIPPPARIKNNRYVFESAERAGDSIRYGTLH